MRNDLKTNTSIHLSERDIELIWISVRRKNLPPIMIGTYYGKQESTSKDEIEKEMMLLTEEILEMENEGEILLTMDGNAKIGILDEPISRNGQLLLKVAEATDLILMNKTPKCIGKITRTNTSNISENSAIDFVLASSNVEKWILNMTIDEDGLAKITGKKPSDHNSIILDIEISNIDKAYTVKRTTWNIRAPQEKWTNFTNALTNSHEKAHSLITSNKGDMNERYNKWLNQIEKAAWGTIGKTTTKNGTKKKVCPELEEKQKNKKNLKNLIGKESDKVKKENLIKEYKILQEQIKSIIIQEKTVEIEEKFHKIATDNSRASFWREKRNLSKNPMLESLTIKDNQGHRVYSPQYFKEVTALYYEDLYRKKDLPTRDFHLDLKLKITEYSHDTSHENLTINNSPTASEIAEIIARKKNGKSTTDLKNEMVKRPGEAMLGLISPLIDTVWKEESTPDSWKKGLITSIWKGRGDKETLNNHRGITVSSTLGNIMEELIDNRILKTISYTQAQGGGIKGCSTYDHIFLIRSLIAISLKEKRPTFLSFYDVSKAFDTVDNEDMLAIMWQKGLKGKTWRLLKDLTSNLKASVRTRHGNTREIDMEVGGRQGSKLTGRMFSKLMDLLAEQVIHSEQGIAISRDFIIGILLWMDDVVSCVEGEQNQLDILEKIDSFAKDHKLKWGVDKCKVMPIGKHSNRSQWKLGELDIQNCTNYKYLGDIISNNGKNKDNITERRGKMMASTLSINTIASSEVLNRIETAVLLELHEKISVPTLLNNAESWDLMIGEQKELQQIEILNIKCLFNLPTKTPTPAILYSLGIPYTYDRISKKQLLYLHRLLNQEPSHWTRKMLNKLESLKLGWSKKIRLTLEEYELSTNFTTIKNIPFPHWKSYVLSAIEKRHKKRLYDECHKTENGHPIPKTKTASIVHKLNSINYIRKPCDELMSCNKTGCKTVIMARFGMLECGKNFKGTLTDNCVVCNTIDDEEHRLNHCKRFSEINFHDSPQKIPFDTVFSTDTDALHKIIERIKLVWNVSTAHGSMNI